MVQGRTLPWLQATAGQDAWRSWGVTFRDVVILDIHDNPFASYNLTINDLSVPAHREELKQLLRAAAAVP